LRKKDEDWALFWCSLLQPIIFGEVTEEEIYGLLKAIAQEERLFPNGTRRKPSLTTLRRKLVIYRQGGFQAFARKARSDRGKPRSHPLEVIQRAIELKRDQPRRSEETINKFLLAERGEVLPKSTLIPLPQGSGGHAPEARGRERAGASPLEQGPLQRPVGWRFRGGALRPL